MRKSKEPGNSPLESTCKDIDTVPAVPHSWELTFLPDLFCFCNSPITLAFALRFCHFPPFSTLFCFSSSCLSYYLPNGDFYPQACLRCRFRHGRARSRIHPPKRHFFSLPSPGHRSGKLTRVSPFHHLLSQPKLKSFSTTISPSAATPSPRRRRAITPPTAQHVSTCPCEFSQANSTNPSGH